MACGSFFSAGRNKRKSLVHGKRVVGIEHRGWQGYDNERRGKGKSREEGSSEKNWAEISVGILEWLGKVYMYTVRIRIEGGESCKKN